MESSKSDGNNERKPQDAKILVDSQTVGIIELSVEKEIQNVLITSEFDQDQPSCSWKNTGTITKQTTETKQPTIVLAKDISTSSISIDVKAPSQENIPTVQQDNTQSNEPTSHKASPQNIEISPSKLGSLTNLFDNIDVTSVFNNIEEVREPIAQPEIPITNQPRSQPPPPSCRNPVVPSATNRGIHVLNIPNGPINRSLQRQDGVVHIPNNPNNGVLGPPPSYSKSLLDRRINTCTSIQFVAPIPPPSYDGMESELRYAHNLGHGHTGGFTLGLGNTWQFQPQPAYCPICETVIITQVDVRVSRFSHVLAMIMFLLLCWPCCLLPYCLNICNYTFHYCSVCHSYLGARRPFQRS